MVAVPRPRGRPPKQESLFDLLTKTISVSQEDTKERLKSDLAACATDPVRFAETYIKWPEGQSLTAYQRDILSALPVWKRIAVRSPRGAGKTACAALSVIYFALTSEALETDWKVVTTAGAWRQLTKYLWPEIHKWCRRLRWEKLGRKPFSPQTELLALSLKLEYGEAFAVATDNPDLIEGAHATRIFVLTDEAKAVPPAIYDAAEGALSGGGAEIAYAAAFSTPGPPSGRFFEINTRRTQYADWWVRPVTMEETVAAGRLTEEAIAARRRQWGETDYRFRAQVLAQFSDEGNEGVIPLSWVEAAQQRWEAWEKAGKPRDAGDPVTLGVDVARQGDDLSAIAIKRGPVIERILTFAKQDTMETTGHVASLQIANPGALAVVDEIGVGASVVDRLREQKYAVEAFNASASSPGPDRTGELVFLNKRSWAFWLVRDLLDPAQDPPPTLALPPDEVLVEDLCAPRWKKTSAGRIQLEEKDSIKKRIGRSPDVGEAVIMAVAGEQSESLVAFY